MPTNTKHPPPSDTPVWIHRTKHDVGPSCAHCSPVKCGFCSTGYVHTGEFDGYVEHLCDACRADETGDPRRAGRGPFPFPPQAPPWKWDGDDLVDANGESIIWIEGDDTIVCESSYAKELIAVAPEMEELLRKLNHVDMPLSYDDGASLGALLARLDAARAKDGG